MQSHTNRVTLEKLDAERMHDSARSASASEVTSVPGLRHPKRWAVGACLLVGVGLAVGFVPKWAAHRRVAEQTQQLAVSHVIVVHPAAGIAPPPLTLSGEIRPLTEAAISARVSGYVAGWHADIGARVEAGQLLAELETPDLDREESQAKAELQQAEAAAQLARATAMRWSEMLKSRTVSSQEADEKSGDAQFKLAAVDAARSKLQRLQEVKKFAQITAPFAGTIIERKLDLGQLVNVGAERPLFRLAQTEKVRVFVRVPQSNARTVVLQQKAEIVLPEIPGKSFEAHVVRTAGAIDPVSRTLLVELESDNPHGEFMAGSYAQVRLSDAHPKAPFTIPSNTLLFRSQGPIVATVTAGNQIALCSVTLGRDFGANVEILSGLLPESQVVINPADSLSDGLQVVVETKP